jgi:hypothetical protein
MKQKKIELYFYNSDDRYTHTQTLQMLPLIDGHFWIMRDGNIIDWDFVEYRWVKNQRNCNDTKTYLAAPIETQKIMINLHYRCLSRIIGTNDKDECSRYIKNLYKKMGFNDRMFDRCFTNCIIEVLENGGELVFGSFGWEMKNGGVWFEYGGEDYTTLKQFMK